MSKEGGGPDQIHEVLRYFSTEKEDHFDGIFIYIYIYSLKISALQLYGLG